MTRTYFVCRWLHDYPNEPVDLYSELDADRYELRKVYVFRDGHGEIAGPSIEMGSTFLSPVPYESLEEIAADPQFEPQEISKTEFEAVWKKFGGE